MKQLESKKAKKKLYSAIVAIIFIMTLCTLPIWRIDSIIVEDNKRYTKEEIVEATKMQDEHLFNLSLKKIKKRIVALPYIKDATVTYHFPSKITINIVEEEPFGYVPFMGTYLCIDEKGQVITQTNVKTEGLPVIKGVQFSEFKIGEVLPVKNEDHLLAAVEVINILKKYKYDTNIAIVDIYNLEQIHLYVDNLDVIIGNIEHFDEKVQWLIEIHKTHDMGRLDLSQVPSEQIRLSPIT